MTLLRTAVAFVLVLTCCQVAYGLPSWWPNFKALPQVRALCKENENNPQWEENFAEFVRRSLVELQRDPSKWREIMPTMLAQVQYYSQNPRPIDHKAPISCGYMCSKWLGYKKMPELELPVNWGMVMPLVKKRAAEKRSTEEEHDELVVRDGPRDVLDVVNTPNCNQMPVKGQGPCEGCWAYASADLITLSFCYYGLSTANSSLNTQASVQAILDCAASAPDQQGEMNAGCSAGDPAYALRLAMGLIVTSNLVGTGGTRGLPNASLYPLTILSYANGQTGVRTSGQCLFRQNWAYQFYFGPDKGITSSTPMTFASGALSEAAIMDLFVAGLGPVVTTIKFAQLVPPGRNNFTAMLRYDGIDCPIPNEAIDHVLLITGYGYATAAIDGAGVAGAQMWKLRNSWSVSWGEGGNAHIQADWSNTIYPLADPDFYWGTAACSIGVEAWAMLPPNVGPQDIDLDPNTEFYNADISSCTVVGALE